MSFHQLQLLLMSFSPVIGFTTSIIAVAIAIRIVFRFGRGCADCGASLTLIDGTCCSHCVALKRSIAQAHGDREKGLRP